MLFRFSQVSANGKEESPFEKWNHITLYLSMYGIIYPLHIQ
jgi:hypothetical protein